MAADHFAVVDRRGVIEILDHKPEGLITIAVGSRRTLTRKMNAVARHAWNGKLLVPGVPEAEDDDAALDALIAFRDWIAPHAGNPA